MVSQSKPQDAHVLTNCLFITHERPMETSAREQAMQPAASALAARLCPKVVQTVVLLFSRSVDLHIGLLLS